MGSKPTSVQHIISMTVSRDWSSVPMALKVGWIEADNVNKTGFKAEMTTGSGVGSPYLILAAEKNGKHYIEHCDITEFFADWCEMAETILDALAAGETKDEE